MAYGGIPGTRVSVRRGTLRLVADHVASVAALAVTSVGHDRVTEVDVELQRWRPPQAGWLGTPRLPGIAALTVEPTRTAVHVRLRLATPTDPGLALAAIVRVLRPTAPLGTTDELTVTSGLPATAGTLAGWLRDALLPDERRDRHVRRADTLACSVAPPADAPERTRTVVVEPTAWVVDGRRFEADVDPAVHRPVGRRGVGPWVVATAAGGPDGAVSIDAPGAPVVVRDELGPAGVSALRGVDAVVGDSVGPRLARQLSACGVVVARSVHDLPAVGAQGEQSATGDSSVEAFADLAWQAKSVHERRHALRQHTPWAALDAWPSVSVVLVTHRPEQVDHALAQAARLAYPRLEVVLGLHGDRIDSAGVAAAARALPHPVTVVPVASSQTLGEALQRCSDRAEGTLVTKMDDDDHYGTEHIWDLVLARAYSGAQVVGKALDWVHLVQDEVTVFRPVYAAEKYASFVAGGTMLISRADLAAVGGWRPVPRSVDRALLDRVRADGGLVYRTHGLGYTYVRRAGDRTASVRDEHFLTRTTATFPGLARSQALGTA